MLYFFLLPAPLFRTRLVPSLTCCVRQRNFGPSRDLLAELLAGTRDIPADSLLRSVTTHTPFDRRTWRALVGEFLVHAATDIPRIATAPEALGCLLAADCLPPGDRLRNSWPPIWQAYLGSRDLEFGGSFYRPDAAGWNDTDDVRRLRDYLGALDTSTWRADALLPLAELSTAEERLEELEFARACLVDLTSLYDRALHEDLVVISEML